MSFANKKKKTYKTKLLQINQYFMYKFQAERLIKTQQQKWNIQLLVSKMNIFWDKLKSKTLFQKFMLGNPM